MLFKHLNPNHVGTGAIDTDALARHVSTMSKNITWDAVKPIIEDTEVQFLIPAIGQELYEELDTAYGSYPGSALGTENAAIIPILQRAIAWKVYHAALQQNLVLIGEAGPRETGDTKGASQPVRQWAYYRSLNAAEEQAYFHLNRALKFLDDNHADYPTWEDSTQYTDRANHFISDYTHLQAEMMTSISSVVFQRMKPVLYRAERNYILPVLGQAFFDELITAKNATPSAIQSQAIALIRRALAQFAVRFALPSLGLHIREGVVAIEFSDGIQNARKVQPESQESANLWIDLQTAGDLFLVELREFLIANAASFSTWKNSTSYTQQNPATGLGVMPITRRSGEIDGVVFFG